MPRVEAIDCQMQRFAQAGSGARDEDWGFAVLIMKLMTCSLTPLFFKSMISGGVR